MTQSAISQAETSSDSDFKWIAGARCEGCQGTLEVSRPNQYEPRGFDTHSCISCKGTGYRFPWLWVRCKHWRKDGGCDNCRYCSVVKMAREIEPCALCKGTGYVLIEGKGERLLGVLDVTWMLANHMEVDWSANCAVRLYTALKESLVGSGAGDTFFDALSSAIRKAL